MPEHLSGERLSALLDDDAPTEEERRHLEGCSACEDELHRIRRMRMALSALDDLEAPADGWSRVEAALSERAAAPAETPGTGEEAGPAPEPDRRGGRSAWSLGGAWVRAAAAVVLFAGGLALGTHLSGPSGGTDGPARGGDAAPARTAAGERVTVGEPTTSGGAARPAERPAGAVGGADPAGTAGLSPAGETPLEAYRDPAAAAERLARLDAVMQAAREAIREDPSDPAMNDLLFRVAEDRQALIDALHLATLEYR